MNKEAMGAESLDFRKLEKKFQDSEKERNLEKKMQTQDEVVDETKLVQEAEALTKLKLIADEHKRREDELKKRAS